MQRLDRIIQPPFLEIDPREVDRPIGAAQFLNLLERLLEVPPRSRGTIYFDSCGGSAYAGISLAGLIRLRGLRAGGVVLHPLAKAIRPLKIKPKNIVRFMCYSWPGIYRRGLF